MSLRGMREVDFYIRGLGEDMMLPTGFQMIPCCVLSAAMRWGCSPPVRRRSSLRAKRRDANAGFGARRCRELPEA